MCAGAGTLFQCTASSPLVVPEGTLALEALVARDAEQAVRLLGSLLLAGGGLCLMQPRSLLSQPCSLLVLPRLIYAPLLLGLTPASVGVVRTLHGSSDHDNSD